MLKFTKMQGCGNDYIYIDCFETEVADPSELSRRLSRRGLSVGADGVILICPSAVADAKMRIFNADGGEGKMCGNGVRCVGKYLFDSGRVRRAELTVETLSGIKTLTVNAEKGVARTLTVDMGRAELSPEAVPVRLDGEAVINRSVTVGGTEYRVTCVSMGNPHCVVFCDDPGAIDIERVGAGFEHSELFPDSVNTEFTAVRGANELEMRVWERGSGETLACGTGACAAAVAAVLNGLCEKGADITVKLRGGELVINYTDERVLMTGPAVRVYDGLLCE